MGDGTDLARERRIYLTERESGTTARTRQNDFSIKKQRRSRDVKSSSRGAPLLCVSRTLPGVRLQRLLKEGLRMIRLGLPPRPAMHHFDEQDTHGNIE